MRKAIRLHDMAKGNARRQKTRHPAPETQVRSKKWVYAGSPVRPDRVKKYLHASRTA